MAEARVDEESEQSQPPVMGAAGDGARSTRSLRLIGLAVLVAVVFLAIGSDHPGPSSDATRVAAIESVLKCPSCEDLSIGQSTSPDALRLDAIVVRDVRGGESNAAIESGILAKFPGSILVPQGGIGTLAIVIPIVLVALGAAVGIGFLIRRRRTPSSSSEPDGEQGDEELVRAAKLARRG